jgi:putative membrane protein
MKTELLVLLSCTALAACSNLGTNSPNASGGASGAKVSAQDEKFARDISHANLAEIATGKLAMSKAQSDAVRKFGQHMVDEHSTLQSEASQLASAKGMPVPSSPDLKHQAEMKKLELASGQGFDRAYMQQMVKDHTDTLQLLQQAAAQASDPQLKAQAQKAIPHVQQHLQMAQQLMASVGGSTGASSGSSSRGPTEAAQ